MEAGMVRWVLVVAAVYAICCAMALGQPVSTREDPNQKKAYNPAEPPPTMAELLARNNGSLMRAGAVAPDTKAGLRAVSMLAVPEPEPRTLKKHDLVTIIIREESDFSSSGSTDLKKQANLDARLEEFVKLNLRNLEIQGGALGDITPSVRSAMSRDFKGEATVERTDRFTTRVTAEVLDVKPNGTVVLQARTRVKTDDEVQETILTGICRATDVSVDNTILSTQLYDLSVSKSHTGAVRDNTQRGWLVKLLDVINPF